MKKLKNTDNLKYHYDVAIIGAGASGLMCAIEAAQRGRKVIILEKANKAAKKILISGGGRCNFTNTETTADNYLSDNPHFCKSALARYTPWDFLQQLERNGLSWNEKAKGQLFCDQKAPAIADLLISQCAQLGVTIAYSQTIKTIENQSNGNYSLSTENNQYTCSSLVVACGGPSIPKMGATSFALDIAKQFKQKVKPFIAGLVPFLVQHNKPPYSFNELSGVALTVSIRCNNMTFTDDMLITHRGLSGPVVLQISSYWQAGDKITIDLAPHHQLSAWLLLEKENHPRVSLQNTLSKVLPKRLSHRLVQNLFENNPLNQLNTSTIQQIADQLHCFQITPDGTEGMRTAEVSLGGVSTEALSSKTFESLNQSGLFFIGECIDVTGHLGGYNFQWAWASGWCAGQYV